MRLDAASPRTWLLATVAGWAVLAWVLALAGMGRATRLLDDDASLVQALPQSRPPAQPRVGPLTQYGEIAARPLLMDDRRPRAFFVQGKGDEAAQANTFDYVLTSVLITPTLQMAILQPADGSESVRVKLGEVPESHPAWRLSSLDPRRAVFEGPEGRREMDLRVYDGQGGQPPTAVAVPPAAAPNPSGPNTRPPPPPPQPVARSATAMPAPVATNGGPAQVAPVTNSTTTIAPSGSEPMTEQAQMEAIRKRIEARRAQLRQQQAQQPPAKTP
ncbi:general secretion pathway protein GspN [Lysobacter sp. 5GHs7-4]|uniref:general secretion pathway protein GspN n=1 Tax=Lysobacter sp. 5GHs7-4 TaxID=2904253 RepID=UPI001E3FB789|nr:general secretion pathway protein GspN [Lysobacter sp. 5GHs7-4]UHQ22615.1 general secretion pathway protein GspN [Lysobacter sp. 5GHs7-4]